MEADIHTVFESGYYRMLDFRCRCRAGHVSHPEHSHAFSISFVRQGNFLFNVYRQSLDAFSGGVLITKPGFERTVSHVHTVPDACTIFEFKDAFYQQLRHDEAYRRFFDNRDLHSTLVNPGAEAEFLHAYAWQQVQAGATRLELDETVTALATLALSAAGHGAPGVELPPSLKRHHLSTLETAKQYMQTHLTENISLKDIADHCHVSAFHFSRIFRTFTGQAPHRFLLGIRLTRARTLLQRSEMPVTEVGYEAGFNSPEHFSAAFRRAFGAAPSAFRRKKS